MSAITTHVLNIATGQPAVGIAVKLKRLDGALARAIGKSATDADGRVRDLLPPGTHLEVGDYQLEFETGSYFSAHKVECFYPTVRIRFTVRDPAQHYHVPLLLSPFGYSTYRGS